ncbi:hypothetical protein, partial [Rhizobium brockwellii]
CSSGSPPPEPLRFDDTMLSVTIGALGLFMRWQDDRHIRHYDLRHPYRSLAHEIAPIVLTIWSWSRLASRRPRRL